MNDIAVVNSTLLREYALINQSVRCLMKAVKQWANKNKISSAQVSLKQFKKWLIILASFMLLNDIFDLTLA